MRVSNIMAVFCVAAMASISSAQTPTPVVEPVHGTVSNPRDTAMSPDNRTINEVDRTFLKTAFIGGMFEVQSSQLATTMSQNQAVKAFAQQMIQDHTSANQKLRQLAVQKYVATPSTLDEQHAKMLKTIASSKGAEFDAAYGRAQLKAHKGAVELFSKASRTVTDPDVKKFAIETLPTLQQHLQMAKELPGADVGAGSGVGADAGADAGARAGKAEGAGAGRVGNP